MKAAQVPDLSSSNLESGFGRLHADAEIAIKMTTREKRTVILPPELWRRIFNFATSVPGTLVQTSMNTLLSLDLFTIADTTPLSGLRSLPSLP